MYSQKEIQQLVVRLKEYYPNRADEAVEILMNEYELSMPIIASIMYLVKTIAEKNSFLEWSTLNAQTQPFYVN